MYVAFYASKIKSVSIVGNIDLGKFGSFPLEEQKASSCIMYIHTMIELDSVVMYIPVNTSLIQNNFRNATTTSLDHNIR